MKTKSTVSALFLCILSIGIAVADEPTAIRTAEEIRAATKFSGGLIVHLGCGTGQLTAALAGDGHTVVHGLTPQAAEVAAARAHIHEAGLDATVSVMRWSDASLPYVDHLVNLIVVEEPGKTSKEEWLRVLVPGGRAYVRNGDTWSTFIKPMRSDVDEWTHYLYSASGNPVSQDKLVGPPRHLQWTAGPAHTRSHEYTSSIAAVVSSDGRLFYIADEGPTGNLQRAADWHVVSRDAYNGLLLWKRDIDQWYTHLAGWTSVPIQLQRRLVAVKDRVYVTLGYHAPVSALDARTGATLRVYEETGGADEILWHDGVLIVSTKAVTDQQLVEYQKLVDAARRRGSPLHERETGQPLISTFNQMESRLGRSVIALDAESGETLWKLTGQDTAGLKPLSLRACSNRVYYHHRGALICLELRSGKQLWSRNCDAPRTANQDAIVCWNKNAVTLLAADDGSVRWTQKPTLESVRDVFITSDSIWIGGFKPYDTGRQHTGPVWGPYFAVQRDLNTGEILREIAPENPGHHQRCYSSKATQRYLLGGRRGTEFIDLETGDCLWNSWARGVCRYGVMPANGLLYVPPHSCGCYITAKLIGFNAMMAERTMLPANDESTIASLERDSAYGDSGELPDAEDWPTYRGNPRRSGISTSRVPTGLQTEWQVMLGAPLTAPVVANQTVFLATPDQNRLVALDSTSGRTRWTFVSDARIDSPPTIHEGSAIVGCRDGSVYRLQTADGSLAWRFRAARTEQRIMSHGQLESPWPIHGSVLVDNNVAYFTTGRSSYLDHGIDLYRLNPKSGDVLSVTNVSSPDAETGQQPNQYNANQMPGARADILVADSNFIYLRDQAFSKDGVQRDDRTPHLFTLTDFLDDSWTHRSYWVFAAEPSIATGCSGRTKELIYGRLLLYDDTTVYGYARKNVHWSNSFQDAPYHLYARRQDAREPLWSVSVPVQIQAMVGAGDTLFVAGPSVETVGRTEPTDGRQSATLLAYSTADGTEQARYDLTSPPIFDGMAVARGKLFLTLRDGSVVCMGKP